MAGPAGRSGVAALLLSGVLLAACSGDNGSSPASAPSGGGTTVPVTLQEWAVVPETATVSAGDVTFTVSNSGPEDVHEFVILRTDLEAGSLPTDATGAVSEDGEGMEVVDEIEDLAVGSTQDVTANLAAGKYVLLCNIYSEDEQESHYQLGMRTAFTVD
jgi:uncharacterized cupredoxin-like copper-binding protein